MKAGRTTIVIGTRASPLALAQTKIVVSLLQKKNTKKDLGFEIRKIKTEGDFRSKNPESSDYSGKDAFTKAIDAALESCEIDVAVHSLKDVPVEKSQRSNAEIAAFPKREIPNDVIITKRKNETFASLQKNAKIGTSSTRRAIQLRANRPDLLIVPLHGNVQTRLKKLQNSDLDAIVLAKAGLKRLGIDAGETLPKKVMLPAVGQGCLAVAVRKDDEFAKKIVSKIDDQDTRYAAIAERSFSMELGGGCNLPIAAHATIKPGSTKRLILEGMIENVRSTSANSNLVARASISGSPKDAKILGIKLALRLKKLVGGEVRR